MEPNSNNKPVISDIEIFYSIAKESYKSMLSHLEAGRRPKKNGEPGWILTPDPERKSYKDALITIVFCSVFLEALLHLLIVRDYGVEEFDKVDRKLKNEEKLNKLGCDDPEIVKSCEILRAVRRGIVHEKAHKDKGYIRMNQKRIHVFVAQDEAEKAVALIDKVIAYFKLNLGR